VRQWAKAIGGPVGFVFIGVLAAFPIRELGFVLIAIGVLWGLWNYTHRKDSSGLHMLRPARNRPTDDERYETTTTLELEDGTTAKELVVAVEGASVQGIVVRPDVLAGMFGRSATAITPEGGTITMHPPLHLRYLVSIQTEKPEEDLAIKAWLQ
jgi:hypothetical protein